MYNRINKNLKRYYKTNQELINRIDQINKHFDKKCEIIDSYFKLLLVYDDEVVKINLQHTEEGIENLNCCGLDF